MRVRPLFLHSLLLLGIAGCDLGDRPLADADELFDRAVSLFQERSFSQAESLFVQAIANFEQQGRYRPAAEGNRYLGQIYLADGRLESALRRFENALQQTRSANDFRSEIQVHLMLGDTYSRLGRYHDAVTSYRAGRKLAAAFNDGATGAVLEMKSGDALVLAGRPEDALVSYQAALSFYQVGQQEMAAAAFKGIGEVYAAQGNYAEAQNAFAQARTLLERLDQPVLDARIRLSLGLVHRVQHQYDEALQEFRDAANMLRARKLGREVEILLLFNIGVIYLENSQFTDARRYFIEAARIAQSLDDEISEAYLQLLTARCDEALMPPGQRLQAAEKLIQTYLRIAGRFGELWQRSGEIFALLQAARLHESVGRAPRSIELYERAVSIEEGSFGEFVSPEWHAPYRKLLMIDSEVKRAYDHLGTLLLQMRKPNDALEVLERGAAKHHFELLQDSDLTLRHPLLKDEVRRARSGLREIGLRQTEISSLLAMRRKVRSEQLAAPLQLELERLQNEVTTLAREIVRVYPNYGPLLGGSSVTVGQIQAVIPRGTLVLRYLPAKDQLHLFALTRNRLEVRSVLVGREKLLGLMEEYWRLLHDPNVYTGSGGEASVPSMTRFATLSAQLYDYLIRPADALLERNLVVITSPEFENFPFHTLEKQERAGTVKYLVELTSVDYLPSLNSLRFKTASSPRVSQIVALGNPTGKNWSIDYELRDIRSFFKEAAILISLEASWDNLLELKGDVLQLSTDFIAGEGRTALGTVAFSNGQTLEEAVRLPFEKLSELEASPITMLSNQHGQGFGLTPLHALVLRLNGASDVFLNAWYADRKAAKYFSEHFYSHLANGLAPGDAYRQALLNLIRTRDVNHPHSWGQFFHFGVG